MKILKNILIVFFLLGVAPISSNVLAIGTGTTVPPPDDMPPCSGNEEPANTACEATEICNLNGYCGTTSSSYSADYWSQLGGATIQGAFCGSIENNAFLTFTAEESNINFEAYVYNCTTNEAIQIMIFEAANCNSGPVTSFVCVDEMYAQNTPYNVSASGLTPGNQYYIMIDGFAGDVCDYTFVAEQGIAVGASVDDATICVGETVSYELNPDGVYEWYDYEGNLIGEENEITITPPAEVGTYQYTLFSDGDCGANAEVDFVIEVVNGDAPSFNQINPICEGGSFSLPTTSTNGIAGTWSPAVNNTETTTYTFTPSDPGVLQCSGEVTMEVEVLDISLLNIDPVNPLCETANAVSLSASPSGGAFSGNGVSNNMFNPNSAGVGSHTITYEYTNSSGCSNTDEITVEVLKSPNFTNITQTPACYGECNGEAVVNMVEESSSFTYHWINENGEDMGINSSNPTTLCAGKYNIEIVDNSGCSIEGEITIEEEPELIADFTIDNFCEGEEKPAVLSNTNSNGTFEIISPIDSATINASNGKISNGIGGTTYTIEYTVSSGGCSNSHQENSTIYPTPVPAFEADITEGCAPLKVTFENLTNLNGSDYIWSFGDGTTFNNNNDLILYTFNNEGSYDISLTATSPEGCSAKTIKEDYIIVYPQPIASFSASPEIITSRNPQVEFTNHSENENEYTWDFGDGSEVDHTENPKHTYSGDEEADYIVTLIVSSGPNCKDSIRAVIQLEEEIIYYIPNAFTPDGDDYNEIFKPIFTSGFDPYEYNLYIYNRWGEIMFESHDSEIGWDGTYGGSQRASDGTYVWKIVFKEKKHDKHTTINGFVSLMR